MKIRTLEHHGFTLVEIMIVVAIIGMLAAIAIPSYVKARDNSQTNACINNLRQIDGAAQNWALEYKKQSSDPYTLSILKTYLKLTSSSTIPGCPAGGSYSPGATITNSPTCDIAGHGLP